MDFLVSVIRSRRRTMCLEITPDCRVLLRAPWVAREEHIQAFIKEKEDWITTHLKQMKEKQAARVSDSVLSREEIRGLAEKAAAIIPSRVAHFAGEIGVTYGRITIRSQKTRWGSCSAKGNLNFNCLLMMVPDEVLDYVIVHELCHRKEMNHSPGFWAQVERILPDYRRCRHWLKENGGALIARMIGE